MTEIAMRVARALGKRNMINESMSIEKIARVVDEVANIQLLLDGLSGMTVLELVDVITSKKVKGMGTF